MSSKTNFVNDDEFTKFFKMFEKSRKKNKFNSHREIEQI